MTADWRGLIGPHGRLARIEGGRSGQHLARFRDPDELNQLKHRAEEFGLTPSALLHIAGLYFQAPSDAPTRFQPAG